MPRLSEAQIEKARDIDLLTYLEIFEPDSFRKSGRDEFCLVEHDSFKLSNGKWYWFSRGFGGHSALDYLVKVQGVGFVDAVLSLTGGYAYEKLEYRKTLPKMNSPPKPKKPFILPKASTNNDRAYAYLRGRGIGREIIIRCIEAGILYESASRRCVFVGKDGNIPKFACERGIEDNHKKDISGSDKRYSFSLLPEILEPSSNRQLAVFESPVDVLANYEIHKLCQTGWDGYRLSLGGVSPIALISFLERHPEITSIQLCLDNDKSGIEATERIIKKLIDDKRFSHIKAAVVLPPIGKDYSDTLMAMQRQMDKSDVTRSFEVVI